MLYFHEKTADGFNARRVDKVLCNVATLYQTVTIVTHELLGRTLYLNDCFQSDDSFREEYHTTMVNLGRELVSYQFIKDVLICGSGPGGLTKVCSYLEPQPKIIAVELDSQAYELYQQFLGDWGLASQKINQVFGDAFQYIAKSATKVTQKQFDLILWDIDAGTLPDGVIWRSQLETISKILRVGGAFVATAGFISERTKEDPYRVFIESCKKAFPNGKIAEFSRMNWAFFGVTNAS